MKKILIIAVVLLVFSGFVFADPGEDCLNNTESVNPVVEVY